MNIKLAVDKKDSEIKSRKDKTLEVYHLIKNDCLDHVIKESIEFNFSSYVSLSNMFIIEKMATAMGFDGVDYQYLDTLGFGVDSRLTIRFDAFSASNRKGLIYSAIGKISSENDPSLKDYTLKLEKDIESIQEKEEWAKIIVDTIDYNYLVNLLSRFIKSKGFKSITRTRIYGCGRTEFLDFTISKKKLLEINQNDSHGIPCNPKQKYLPVVAILLVLIVFLLFAF